MNISDIEYIVPTQANQIGSIKFKIEVPIAYKEGDGQVPESDDAQIELSPDTQEIIQHLAESIIKDINKK